MNEIKEKYLKLGKINNEDATNLKECLSSLSKEGLDELYNLYDVFEVNKKTKQAKINYLYNEIPGQFLDDWINMMDKEKRLKLIKIINYKQIDIDQDIIHFISFGYVYITPSNKLIVPNTLYYFLENLYKK